MVFKTISENVRSFFQKEKELERPPKAVPDAAIEIYEKPSIGPPQRHQIVAHPIKEAQLPFTAAQLRERAKLPEPAKRAITQEDIALQIEAFEHAIKIMPGEDGSRLPLSTAAPASSAAPLRDARPARDGLFSDFARFLEERGYESFDDSLLSQEVVSRLRAHHEQKRAAERHQSQGKQLEATLSHTLAELQGLEHDWASKHEEIAAAGERILELENDIVEKTAELKRLVNNMRGHLAVSPAFPVAPLLSSTPTPSSCVLVPSASTSPLSPVSLSPAADPVSLPPISSPQASAPLPPVPLSSSHHLALHEAQQQVTSPVSAASSSPAVSASVVAAPTVSSPVPSPLFSLPPQRQFHLFNGGLLASLAQLRAALPSMSDEVFAHHVRPERNDFAAWVRDVFHDEPLAARIAAVRSRLELSSVLSGS